jgi:hypothetical protein
MHELDARPAMRSMRSMTAGLAFESSTTTTSARPRGLDAGVRADVAGAAGDEYLHCAEAR